MLKCNLCNSECWLSKDFCIKVWSVKLNLCWVFCKLGGLDFGWSCLDWDSWSWHHQKVCLDSREISIEIKISRFWLIMSRVRLLILTSSKSLSRQSRNLNWDQDFSILSRHQCPDTRVLIKIEKFVETRKFCHFLTVCFDLDREVSGFLHISCQDFSSRFLKTSRLFAIFRLKKSWFSKDFCIFLVKISQNVKTFCHFQTQKVLI